MRPSRYSLRVSEMTGHRSLGDGTVLSPATHRDMAIRSVTRGIVESGSGVDPLRLVGELTWLES